MALIDKQQKINRTVNQWLLTGITLHTHTKKKQDLWPSVTVNRINIGQGNGMYHETIKSHIESTLARVKSYDNACITKQ